MAFELNLEFLTNLTAVKYQLFFEYRYWKVDIHQSELGTIRNALEGASEIMWKLEDELKLFLTEFLSDLPGNVLRWTTEMLLKEMNKCKLFHSLLKQILIILIFPIWFQISILNLYSTMSGQLFTQWNVFGLVQLKKLILPSVN